MNLRTCCDWPGLGRTVLATSLVSFLFPVLAYTHGMRSWSRLGRELFTAWVFSNCIGIPANFIPWGRLESRASTTASRWAVRILILLGLAGVGTALTCVVFLLLGWLTMPSIPQFYEKTLPLSILLTLFIGSAMIIYESMRARLEKATLRLRTEELERERALKLATEARLASLESRLHPHFLFNTLNSISSLIPEDPGRAEKLVEQMAALLRFSLDSARQGVVPLEKELRIVRDYLEIEQARLGERLTYEIFCGDGLESASVPPLAIQTLVENSIKHVIAPNRAGGWLKVFVERSEGTLLLEVRDSGSGFDIAEAPAGHGLDNLRSRITALYGTEASISTEHKDGVASVSVHLPLES